MAITKGVRDMSENKSENSKITLGVVTSWGLGGFCLLVGILTIFEGDYNPAIGLCFIFMAGLLLPTVRQLVHKKTGKSMSTGLRVVLVLIVFGVAASMMPEVTPSSASDLGVQPSTPAPTNSVQQPAQHHASNSVPEHVKNEIIQRCKRTMDQYGAMMIKGCVDQDLQAYEALQGYSAENNDLIARCESSMAQYGWMIVKGCVDQDIEAQKALSKY